MKKWAGPITVLLVTVGIVSASARQPSAEARNAITEVSVEHTPCYGPCPVYKLTLRHDGTAIFVGFSNVSKIGTYTATVGGFNQLAQALRRHNFQRFQPDYTSGITDLSYTITTVVQGGHRKTVKVIWWVNRKHFGKSRRSLIERLPRRNGRKLVAVQERIERKREMGLTLTVEEAKSHTAYDLILGTRCLSSQWVFPMAGKMPCNKERGIEILRCGARTPIVRLRGHRIELHYSFFLVHEGGR